MRIILWWWLYLWILQILMQLTSQPQTSGYGNISTVTGPHPNCRNWLMYLKFQLHSSTKMWSTLVNQFTHLHSTRIMKDPSLIWTILMHPGTYIGTIGKIFAVSIVVYCFKRFWFRPTTPRHWPYFPVSSWHATVNNNVEAAPIYRSRDTVEEPRRSHRNNDLCIEWEATRWESHCKQPVLIKGVPITGSLAPKAKIQGIQ